MTDDIFGIQLHDEIDFYLAYLHLTNLAESAETNRSLSPVDRQTVKLVVETVRERIQEATDVLWLKPEAIARICQREGIVPPKQIAVSDEQRETLNKRALKISYLMRPEVVEKHRRNLEQTRVDLLQPPIH
ncbi:hypothetical protein [Congregibacter litoralis]|uniref:Uncharacterized protein n=1 Tax=Congregibacter litoralis KT71 TaxID=314285 RepID=A4ACG6_9GAMM|nr:hypothetical protein [Congregibacter litoralis]EAQ96394.1 hypothetical protein KT71_13445 [Congregibacter litoralis KT71]